MADRVQDGVESSRASCYSTAGRYQLRFTKSGCTPVSCLCLVVASASVALGAAAGVYFGLGFLGATSPNEKVFKGKLVVTRGDDYQGPLDDVLSPEFVRKADFYRNILDTLYRRSWLKENFRQSEILAFGRDERGLLVHFNLRLAGDGGPSPTATDLYVVLIEEVRKTDSDLLAGLRIDHRSIHIREREADDRAPTVWTPRKHYPGYLERPTTSPATPVEVDRRCVAIQLDFCQTLSYNATSYPNLVGHRSVKEVTRQLVSFRQIVDLECYAHAQELICQLLQPDCQDNRLTYPCRHLCREFLDSCRPMLRPSTLRSINCSQFPQPPEQCRDKTGLKIGPAD